MNDCQLTQLRQITVFKFLKLSIDLDDNPFFLENAAFEIAEIGGMYVARACPNNRKLIDSMSADNKRLLGIMVGEFEEQKSASFARIVE